jgi:hypothetical protein
MLSWHDVYVHDKAIVIIMVCSFLVFFMFWYRVVSLGCNSFLLTCGVHGWAMRLFLCFVILWW